MDEQSNLNSEAAKSDTTLISLDGPSTSPETPFRRASSGDVRLAGVSDLGQLVKWGQAFHSQSPWSDTPFDPYKMKVVLLEMIEDEDAVVIMHDHGVIGGSIITPYFNNIPVAQELFWYAEKDGMELLKAFEAWAYVEGAELVSMAGTGIRPKALDRLYRQHGYSPRETFYVKRFEED